MDETATEATTAVSGGEVAGGEVVLVEVSEGVALITLSRPERLNAWTSQMHREYFDILEQCAAASEVRAIVLTGAGRGFCAGADMQDLQSISGGGDGLKDAAAGVDPRPHIFPLSIPKPIIAAINGGCAGLGLVHALMCDFRLAAQGAKLTTAFARRGLVAEYGISWILPRLVGASKALDLLLSGRVVLAEEAQQLGLVDRVTSRERIVEEATDYARELAQFSSPASMAAIKRQVYGDLGRDLAASIEVANREMAASFTGPDFGEGVASFVERRPPRFAGLSARPFEPAEADAARA